MLLLVATLCLGWVLGGKTSDIGEELGIPDFVPEDEIDVSFLDEEGWLPGSDSELASDACTIDVMEGYDHERFQREYRGLKPVIIRDTEHATFFKTHDDLKRFVRDHYNLPVGVFLPYDHPTVGGRVTTMGEYFRSFRPVFNKTGTVRYGDGSPGSEIVVIGEEPVVESTMAHTKELPQMTAWGQKVLEGSVDDTMMIFHNGPLPIVERLLDDYVPGLKYSMPPSPPRMCGEKSNNTVFTREDFARAHEPFVNPNPRPWQSPPSGEACRGGSIAMASSGVGLPFHFHEEVCGNLNLWGRKRWFFARRAPLYNNKHNTGRWAMEIWPKLKDGRLDPKGAGGKDDVLECTTNPGDLVYVPNDWYHSTLAVGHVVGVAAACDSSRAAPVLLSMLLRHPVKRPCGIGEFGSEPEQMVEWVRDLVRVMPDQFHPTFTLSKLLLSTVEQRASQVSKEVAEVGEDPTMVEVGLVRKRAGKRVLSQVKQGLKYARRAASLNYLYSEVYSVLAMAYMYMGQTKEGIAAARRALQLDPNDFTTCRRLGKMLLADDPPRRNEARSVVSACVSGLNDRLSRTHSRECALAMHKELAELVRVETRAAVAVTEAPLGNDHDETKPPETLLLEELEDRTLKYKEAKGIFPFTEDTPGRPEPDEGGMQEEL